MIDRGEVKDTFIDWNGPYVTHHFSKGPVNSASHSVGDWCETCNPIPDSLKGKTYQFLRPEASE